MPNEPFLSLMGIARKANKLFFGANDTLQEMKKNKIFLAVIAKDISAKTEKELRFAAGNIPVIRAPFDLKQLLDATGRIAGVLGIADEGFARKSEELLKPQGELPYDD